MGKFKATRIKIENITYDLDIPIVDPVYYQTTKRLPKNPAMEELLRSGHIKAEKELKRQKQKEDALIRALKKIGGVFGPFP